MPTVPRLKPGAGLHAPIEWAPQQPKRLTDGEIVEYRRCRARRCAGAGHRSRGAVGLTRERDSPHHRQADRRSRPPRRQAHDGDADALVSVIAFGGVAEQLAALGKGDAVSMTGRAKVSTWMGKDGASKAGISITADVLLTAYHVKRKRAAMAGDQDQQPRAPRKSDGSGAHEGADEGGDPWYEAHGR